LEEVLVELLVEKPCVPLSVVATDIDKGSQVIFTSMYSDEDAYTFNYQLDESRINDDNYQLEALHIGNFAQAVRASCSIPPIFVPKRYAKMKLVDGGITNNLPSDIAWAMGADKVISLDLGYSGKVETEGFIDISHMAVNILMERVTDGNKKDFGLYMNPSIYDVTALDTGRIAECYQRGYVYGKNNIEHVVKMLEEV
jgi:NTE family protein